MSQFLYSEIREVAIKTGLDIDREIYSRFDKDPLEPIAFAGNPRAQVAFLGRDLGRQEVEYG
ncbi:MAG: uracil-DNA glycosylase, partial [Chthonomonadales bacterium]